MTASTKISGAWKDVSAISTKVSGAWKDVSEGYTKISGAWEQFFAPSAAGSYDLLETEILTGSQASVTFSSLNSTYGADYQHLQIRATARTDRSGSNVDILNMTFNSVTTGSYKSHSLVATGSIIDDPQTSNSNTYMYGFRASAATATSDSFGAGVIDILDAFETSKYTTVRGLGGTDTQLWFTSGLFMSTNAVDSITLDPDAGSNILTGSRFSLYGLRSA